MDKAKIMHIAGYAALFVIGGLVYTHVIPESVALSLSAGVAYLLPSPVSKKP